MNLNFYNSFINFVHLLMTIHSSYITVPPNAKINGPSALVAIRGRNLALSCSAKGFPPPHINWQRNGVPISGASNSDTSGKIYIENIQVDFEYLNIFLLCQL